MAKKGTIPWNKGLSKDTDERVAKYAKTKSIRQRGKPSTKRIYSNNPEDWKTTCDDCGKEKTYVSRGGYARMMRDRKSGKKILCGSCSAIGKTLSEDAKKNMSKSAKKRWKNMSDDERQSHSKMVKYHTKKRWDEMTYQERLEHSFKISEGQLNVDDETKKRWYDAVSESNKKRMKELGIEDKFRPSYNRQTIPYIENILSEQYKTNFIHGESEFGEFKIYDKKCHKFYYADAYSKELNLWVEFDEPNHFRNGKLKKDDIIREKRIKEILKCNVVRIKTEDISI